MIKKIIDHIMVGLGIAFIITNITMYIFLRDISGEQAILSYIIWMCAGILYGALSAIHDTNINKGLAIVIHYIFNLAISIAAFKLMYITVLRLEIGFGLLLPFAIFTIVYVLVGICSYIYEEISVKALNKKLQKK